MKLRSDTLGNGNWLKFWPKYPMWAETTTLLASRMPARPNVYLVDTDVVSELRKRGKANQGVPAFFKAAAVRDAPLYLAAVTLGELRRGVELIRYRGDSHQANLLERWLERLIEQYSENILPFDAEAAQVWGRLRVLHPDNALDKQIAATALGNDLVLITRNVKHFAGTGVRLLFAN